MFVEVDGFYIRPYGINFALQMSLEAQGLK